MQALLRFDSKAAALVLEEEVREAFFGSISTAIGMHRCCAAHQMQHHTFHACLRSCVRRRAEYALARCQHSKSSLLTPLTRSSKGLLNTVQSMTQLTW